MHIVAAALLLTARLYSVANLSPSDRLVATRVAANILQTAGIDLASTDCSERPTGDSPDRRNAACSTSPAADEVLVRFVSTPATAHARERSASDVLGDAFVDTSVAGGSLATVYVDRVDILAKASGIDSATLLGRVMAHEIGHLLLGTTTHRPSGLMRAQWSPALLQRRLGNDWRFSTIDAASVHEGLLRRIETAHAEPGAVEPVVTCRNAAPAGAVCPWCPVCPVSYQPTGCPLTCSSSQALSGAK